MRALVFAALVGGFSALFVIGAALAPVATLVAGAALIVIAAAVLAVALTIGGRRGEDDDRPILPARPRPGGAR